MKKKAFTLIEMLIVVVIIGILAAALIPRLQGVQGRARDTQRKTGIGQIGQGAMIYKSDSQSGNFQGIDNGTKINVTPDLLNMSSIPQDPMARTMTEFTATNTKDYGAKSVDNYESLVLGAATETKNGSNASGQASIVSGSTIQSLINAGVPSGAKDWDNLRYYYVAK